MPHVDDRFLDVDFRRDPRYVKGYDEFGDDRVFGNYEDIMENLSDSEIDDRIAEMEANDSGADELVTRIYDQKQEGSCVANATCQSHEIMQALQFGKDRVTHLSAISVYDFIGRSPSSGAMVSDGMVQIRDVGACPLDDATNRARFGSIVKPNTGFRKPNPPGMEAVMKQFRVDEGDIIRTLKGMLTALVLRRPVVVGRQGHSIVYATARGSKSKGYKAPYPNSWSEQWADNGWGVDSLSQMKMSSGWAWTPRSIIVPDYILQGT